MTDAATSRRRGPDADELGRWMDREAERCAERLARCVSATDLVMRRPGFGQTIVPAPGSIVASPETATGEGRPDYFFDWTRDSAVVVDAVLGLMRSGDRSADWPRRIEDFVAFNLGLGALDGERFLAGNAFRRRVAPEFLRFVRSDAEIAAVAGDAVHDEVRYNADGSLDFIRWSRPQHDGPALRALVGLRIWTDAGPPPGAARERLAALIRRDLGYTSRRAGAPCFDIWEEERGRHYYTTLVQHAALGQGAVWLAGLGAADEAGRCAEGAAALAGALGAFWCEARGFYRSRLGTAAGDDNPKALDISVVLGVLHAGLGHGPHSARDPRVLATLRKLESLFAADYAINRAIGRGLAFGRYKGDTYVSGGAYFLATFGAAELYYRLAASGGAMEPAAALAAGDAILARARDFVPASGELAEQFDQASGQPASARNLSWSYAAFVTAWLARRRALGLSSRA
jgi:glucoamylase